LLLDVVPKEVTPEEKAKGLTLQSPTVRNRLATSALVLAQKVRPAALFAAADAALIVPGNLEDDLEKLRDYDWVIEVVVENLDIKRSLFSKIKDFIRADAILSSNTSGISIRAMSEGLPESLQPRFLGTHFFNPVRYMQLLELIPGPKTNPAIIERISEFAERVLGKGIVTAKDRPNFIANRIGVYGMMMSIEIALKRNLPFEIVDKIVGEPMGRPKSGVFRLGDIVGLDTFLHVAKNVYDHLPEDPERDVFKIPPLIEKMVEQKWLGDKTGCGFYKKTKKDGGKEILVLDPATLTHRPQEKRSYDSLAVAKNTDSVGERIKGVIGGTDEAASYAWETLAPVLCYSARLVGEISDSIVDIDNAMKWGFNWELGPFETWDAIGLQESIKRMEKAGIAVPQLTKDALAAGGTFYRTKNGEAEVFQAKGKSYATVRRDTRALSLPLLRQKSRTVDSNLGCDLLDLGDGVVLASFKTKMNAIDDDSIAMLNRAVDLMDEGRFGALVIGNDGKNFSVGANLMLLWGEAEAGNWTRIDGIARSFQDVNQRLKYCPHPVVSAPFGMALGGGAEVAMAANQIRAHGELYMGLVEVGVGLIPAGGGCKELTRRIVGSIPAGVKADPFPFVQRVFELIGTAKVSTSAKEAESFGFLSSHDSLSMNRDFLIGDAKQVALNLFKEGVNPGRPRTDLRLPGKTGYGAFLVGLREMRNGGHITEYDEHIGRKLCWILCGGDTSSTQTISEQRLLDLEREGFLSLCGEQRSRDRMQHLLMKGKPLRN